jgi:hypothetical protein
LQHQIKKKMNKNTLLSTLWIFVTINYLYCDLIGLMDAHYLKQYLTGEVEGMKINPEFLLVAAILMEIPISMILFSKILKDRTNACANLGASFIKTVVMIVTFFLGNVSIYYTFFGIIEIATTIFIFFYALKWLKEIRLSSSIVS